MIIHNLIRKKDQAFEWSSGFSKLCWINRACAFDISGQKFYSLVSDTQEKQVGPKV